MNRWCRSKLDYMSLRRVEKTSNTSNNEVVCYNFILDMYTYYGNADVTFPGYHLDK